MNSRYHLTFKSTFQPEKPKKLENYFFNVKILISRGLGVNLLLLLFQAGVAVTPSPAQMGTTLVKMMKSKGLA